LGYINDSPTLFASQNCGDNSLNVALTSRFECDFDGERNAQVKWWKQQKMLIQTELAMELAKVGILPSTYWNLTKRAR